ncbi:MAG: fibronectin type III domain-containing protein [Treponema sp.]|jgi:hypothetical protein|nr:fibronectin type III domain-containing protein [Treponema sp.]
MMKKILFSAAAAAIAVLLAACPDANGLHNKKSTVVLFQFRNFPAADGEYAIPGDYNGWDNTATQITITAGEGVSLPVTLTVDEFKFSLVPVNDWSRPWYPAAAGNAADGDVMQNFWVGGIPADTSLRIVCDGQDNPVTPELRAYNGGVLPSTPTAPASFQVLSSTENSITLTWTEAADSGVTYRLYRAASETGTYAVVAESIVSPPYEDTGLSAGTAYWYKVSTVNPQTSPQEGPLSAALSGSTLQTWPGRYPVIDMSGDNKGVLDADFAYGASSHASLSPGDSTVNYDIKSLHVINDETNLYVALDFGDSPAAGWGNDRITVFVDTVGSTGNAEYTSGSKWYNAATTVTVTTGDVDAYLCQVMKETPITQSAASWTQQATWEYTGPVTVKFAIPLSDIGSPAAGTAVRVVAAFSLYWDSGEVIQVKDLIPSAAGTISATTQSSDTLAINFNQALSWTLR